MNFQFSSLLGAPYRGGNLLIQGDELLTPVGNRVSQINLVQSTSSTLPFENGKQIRTICVSPDGRLLLSIDQDGRALLINRKRRALLHHFSFKAAVRAAKFSPDGKYVACAVGRLLQIWKAPSLAKTMAPMELHRTYGHCHADVTDLDWSADSQWVAVASKDLSARLLSLHPIDGYKPPTLTGHKESLVGVHLTSHKLQQAAGLLGRAVPHLYTVSRDGALFGWTYTRPEGAEQGGDAAGTAAAGGGTGGGGSEDGAQQGAQQPQQSREYAGGHWRLTDKHYFHQRGAKLSAAAFHGPSGLLAVGFSGGVFELLQLPDLAPLHTLSIGREKLTSLAFSPAGDWVAVGSAALGQLLVWEWRSESYVLKQQGHYYDVAAAAFSPDGGYLVTGADDAKVKVWTLSNGFCFVTFSEHAAPVTGVAFLPSGHAVVSASLDGTVRAYDLVRYRNFRTLTTPTPVQFVSLAVDPAGEIVCAGSQDSFQIFVWSLKTGRLLDALAAHEGPVVALQFCPTAPLLASASWDKTVRTWDVFSGKGGVESLQHSSDVLALAWRPDGKQLASATLDGNIYFWDPHEAVIQASIAGRRDIAGGRLRSDRRTAANSSSGRAFTSLAFSADGSYLLAGGSSKWVCLYDVAERVMLRRFQVSHNRSLDGVLDMLNSRNMTDAGPLAQLDVDTDEDDDLLPPSTAGGPAGEQELPGTGGGKKAPAVRTRCVTLSPTGRSWAAATTEGVLLYSLDEGLLFDPTDLAEDVTPAAVVACLGRGQHLRALLLAVRLGDPRLVQHCVMSTPPPQVPLLVNTLPPAVVPQLLVALAELLPGSPHLEYLLAWARAVCTRHGPAVQAGTLGGGPVAPALRSLQKALTRIHDELSSMCESNLYTLDYLCTAGTSSALPAAGGALPLGSGAQQGQQQQQQPARRPRRRQQQQLAAGT